MNIKRILAGATSLAMAGSLLTPAAAVKAETPDTQGTDNYIVVVRDDVFPAVQHFTAEGMEVVETTGNRNYVVLSMTVEEAAELAQDECVVSVERDVIVRAMSETGGNGDLDATVRLEDLVKAQEYEWNLAAIHATPDELMAYATDESVVRVAVLDSGMSVCEDLDVAEYVNLVSTEQDTIVYNQDATGHGTAVAGLLAGNIDDEGIIGVAPDVTMYSVRVFDLTNEAPLSRIIGGIYWAIDHDIHIINMSFGTDVNSYALHQAVQAAAEADILMVAAAGNGTCVEYPAAYPEVVAVGATNYQGARADFSPTGDALELVAPGECVLTDSFYGGVTALNGTSLAAPQVAGAAAVLWAKDMSKSSDFIRQLLNASANGSLGTETEYGNGLLDVRRAFEIYDAFEESYVPGAFEYAGIAENLAPYVAGDEPGYVVGSWLHNEHAGSINQGSGISSTVYPTKYLTLMIKTSDYVDGEYGFQAAIIPHLHGGRNFGSSSQRETTNYVNHVVFLYEVARELRKNKGKSLTVAQQKQIVSDVAERMKKVEVDSELVDKVKDLIAVNDIMGVDGISDQTSVDSNIYKVLGAALHLAGDVYAHRSMVPTSLVTNAVEEEVDNPITGSYVNKNHFFKGEACSVEMIEEATYNSLNDESGGNPASKCKNRRWECFALGVSKGMMEFKDIRRFTIEAKKYARQYEDNPLFYKSRYSIGTNYTVNFILKSFANNTALNEELFLPGVYSGKSYGIRLNALKMLYEELGWELKAGENWSTYSTLVVR